MEYKKLEEVCSIITDGTHQTPTYSSDGYVFLSSKNVTSGKIDWDNVKYINEELHNELSKRLKPQRNDILLAKNGTTGIGALVDRDITFDIYVSLALLRPIKEIYPPYLLHMINNPKTKQQFDRNLKGIGVQNLHLKEIKNIEIPVMSMDIQEKIVEILNKAQELIDKRKKQIEALDELIKSQFIEMFGDILHNDKFDKAKLKEIANIGSSKRIYANEYVDRGIPFYRSKEIRELGENLKPSIELFISEEKYDSVKRQFGIPKRGDILVAAIGATIGYTWIVNTDEPFYYKDGNLLNISINKHMNSIYFNHALKILINDFKLRGVSGTAQLALTIEKVENMEVICPSIELQTQFADFVKQVDKLKFEMQKSLEQMENNFNSLMHRAFKGELFSES